MKPVAPSVPSPLQIDIANQLIRQIRDGRIAAGQHLTEQALAQQFGVSRSPVRAALKLLEDHGYVLSRTNAGVSVATTLPDPEQDDELVGGGNTAEDLYRAILSDRAAGELGDILTEAELLARYDVTRSVLMRTLLRVNREGLIARRKGHGWTFLPALDSVAAKQESYRFRMMVECGGLREKTFTVDAPALARMRRSHEGFLQLAPAEQTSAAFFEMNAGFHELLAQFSGNRFVMQMVGHHNRLRRLEEFRRHADNPVNVRGPCQEHLDIIEALEAGDTELAALLMHRHLMRASRI